MILSDRLLAVARLITPGNRVADIGCDHGYLSIYLIQNKISPYIIAMDVNRGPLERAHENVINYECSEDIELRLSDGLKQLKEDDNIDSIVIAGMGGPLMVDILSKGADIIDEASELILQPQSDIALVRHFLEDNQFRIVSEDIVYEDDKFYPMIKAIHGDMNLDKEMYYRYGKILLREKHPVLHQYLLTEKKQWLDIKANLLKSEKTSKVVERLQEVANNIVIVDAAIAECDEITPVEIDRVLD